MKAAVSIASLLTCAFSMNAQIAAVLHQYSTRAPEIEIRNNSAVTLAGFVVTMEPASADTENGAPLVVFVDTAVDPGAMPLLPDQVYNVPVPIGARPGHRMEALYRPPIETAGIFADGTTAGNAALVLVDRLLLRRSNMLQAVELAREILSDAGRHNVARGALIQQFRMMADSTDHWYLPQEQRVGRTLYQSITERLMSLPLLPAGSPFPPAAFVEQATASLNRQRTTLLESRPHVGDGAAVRR